MIVAITIEFETDEDGQAVLELRRRTGPRSYSRLSTVTLEEGRELQTELTAALRRAEDL